MADFALLESQNWFHVKSEWYKNHEISTLWNTNWFFVDNDEGFFEKAHCIAHFHKWWPKFVYERMGFRKREKGCAYLQKVGESN